MVSYGWEQHLMAPTLARRLIHRFLGTHDIGALIRFKALDEALDTLNPPASVLDAGSGRGQVSFHLHRRWPQADILGVDFENDLVVYCRTLAQSLHAQERVAFERRTLPDDLGRAFDLIVSIDVLEHIEDDEGFVRALAQMTQPGGALVLHTPATPQRRFLSEYEEQHDHVREGYAPDVLADLMRRAGYDRVTVRYTFGPLGALAWEILALAKRGNNLARMFLALAYPLAWLDGLRHPAQGNGLIAIARKN
jgi:SAM-dependent methyltransferase